MSSCSQQFQEGQLRFLYIKKRSIQLSVPLTYPSKSLRTSIPSTPPPPKQFKRWILKTPAKPSKSLTFSPILSNPANFKSLFFGGLEVIHTSRLLSRFGQPPRFVPNLVPLFFFCLLWSIGATCDAKNRKGFSDLVRKPWGKPTTKTWGSWWERGCEVDFCRMRKC